MRRGVRLSGPPGFVENGPSSALRCARSNVAVRPAALLTVIRLFSRVSVCSPADVTAFSVLRLVVVDVFKFNGPTISAAPDSGIGAG